jgi:hypothetical protein
MMPILVEASEPLTNALLKKLKRGIELVSQSPNNIEILQGTQSGIWGLFGDMVVVSWVYAGNKIEYGATAKLDAQNIALQLPTIIEKLGLPIDTVTRYALHEGKLVNQTAAGLASQWRILFAQAVIKLEHQESLKDLA